MQQRCLKFSDHFIYTVRIRDIKLVQFQMKIWIVHISEISGYFFLERYSNWALTYRWSERNSHTDQQISCWNNVFSTIITSRILPFLCVYSSTIWRIPMASRLSERICISGLFVSFQCRLRSPNISLMILVKLVIKASKIHQQIGYLMFCSLLSKEGGRFLELI